MTVIIKVQIDNKVIPLEVNLWKNVEAELHTYCVPIISDWSATISTIWRISCFGAKINSTPSCSHLTNSVSTVFMVLSKSLLWNRIASSKCSTNWLMDGNDWILDEKTSAKSSILFNMLRTAEHIYEWGQRVPWPPSTAWTSLVFAAVAHGLDIFPISNAFFCNGRRRC